MAEPLVYFDANGRPQYVGYNAPLPSDFPPLITAASLSGLGQVYDTLDLRDYESISVQLTGAFVATITFEVSNDLTNWIPKLFPIVGSSSSFTLAVPGIMYGDLGARYFRARVSAYTSGTVAFTLLATCKSVVPGRMSIDVLSLPAAAAVRLSPAATPVVNIRTMVAVTAQVLQAANAARRTLSIYNDTTAPLHVRLGAGVSATSFTNRLAIGAYWETPDGYTGLVEGFATGAGAGPVLVTEVV